jgi:hypothetical protein
MNKSTLIVFGISVFFFGLLFFLFPRQTGLPHDASLMTDGDSGFWYWSNSKGLVRLGVSHWTDEEISISLAAICGGTLITVIYTSYRFLRNRPIVRTERK